MGFSAQNPPPINQLKTQHLKLKIVEPSRHRPFAQAGAKRKSQFRSVAKIPISEHSEDPDPSGHREAPARPNAQVSIHPLSVFGSQVTNDERRICRAIKCASACRKFENFRIFSNVSHHFSNIFEYFQTFSIVFERFRTQLAHLVDAPGTTFLRYRCNGGIIRALKRLYYKKG